MTAFYNDNDPFVAAWLQNLSDHGQIPPGRVDRRSIADLTATDVAGAGQRHFFAGIGGWALACRLAGLPDDADIWTGSCPCQGLSDAGQRRGFLDPRHLWPAWIPLIAECLPPVIFGEQVASALGLEWLDLVCADLERCGYTVGASDLCAASVGAPHQRQRLFFVAYADGEPGRLLLRAWRSRQQDAQARRSGEAGELADTTGGRRRPRRPSRAMRDGAKQPSGLRASRNMGDAVSPGLEVQRQQHARREQPTAERGPLTRDFWTPCDRIPCSDGVSRPVEPGTHPLATGVPGRVGLLRGYGNAIVPQVAAEFIITSLDALADMYP